MAYRQNSRGRKSTARGRTARRAPAARYSRSSRSTRRGSAARARPRDIRIVVQTQGPDMSAVTSPQVAAARSARARF